MQKTFLPDEKASYASVIAVLADTMDTRAHVAFADIYNELKEERENAETQANAQEEET